MTGDTITLHQGYGSTYGLYSDLDAIIVHATERLANVDFDTLVGTGMSGSIVIPLLAKTMAKHFVLVRKDDAVSHTSTHVGRLGERWIFCDDFVSTGRTLARVLTEVDNLIEYENRFRNIPFTSVCVGQYLYACYDGPKFTPS